MKRRRIYLRYYDGDSLYGSILEENVDENVEVITSREMQGLPDGCELYLIHLRDITGKELENLRLNNPESFIALASNCGTRDWREFYKKFYNMAVDTISLNTIHVILEKAGLAKKASVGGRIT